MLNLPLYSNQKLLLSFEYGVILAKTAQELGFEITKDMMIRAEEIIIAEFKKNSPMKLSTEMVTNILAMTEPS
jgi:hypothetical protein